MYIKKIVLNNFRIYKGYNEITLAPEGNKNIIIVSGQNGFGKTTFLMSLVWCLYGKNMVQVDEMYKKEIYEKGNYPKYIASCLNSQAAREGAAEFYVEVEFADVNIDGLNCSVTIKRTHNIHSSTSDEVEVKIDNTLMRLDNFSGPSDGNIKGEELFIQERILPIPIAKFFFFDAEKITSLAENNQTDQRRQLSKAYSEVLGIHKYETLKDRLEEKLDVYRKNSAKSEETKRLNELETAIKNTEVDIRKIDSDLQDNDDRIRTLQSQIEDITIRLVKAGDQMSMDELNRLISDKDDLEKKKKSIQDSLKEYFDYIPFALAGETLSNIVEQVENERKLSEMKYKRDDVSEKIKKIRQEIEYEKLEKMSAGIVFPIDVVDFYSQMIDKLVKKHFSNEDEIDANITVLHSFSDSQNSEIKQLIATIKNNFRKEFDRRFSEYGDAKSQLESVNRKIKKAQENAQDEHVNELREQQSVLQRQRSDLEKQMGAHTVEKNSILDNVKNYRKEQTELRKKIDASVQYSVKEQKVKHLIRILVDFIKKFKEQKKESLQSKMLETLTRLLHKKEFVQSIDVDILTSEDIDIVLYDTQNHKIDKGSLSMGERQLYASALLSSLVSESDIDFPVFIDSPMQKFDTTHAENIIKYFYPNIAKQVVLFPLLYKELTEHEYDLLKDNVCKAFLIKNTSPESSEFLQTTPEELFSSYNNHSNNAAN